VSCSRRTAIWRRQRGSGYGDSSWPVGAPPGKPDEQAKFLPISDFDIDPDYASPATLKLLDERTRLVMPTSTGKSRDMERVGILEFTLRGQTLKLTAFAEVGQEVSRLFVPFSDLTSGTESYQAGRYMEEYRKVRGTTNFLDLCKNPPLCSEIMCTAVERLGVDAAIIFSDLLPILEPMGLELDFAKGEGPVIYNPVRAPADVDRVIEGWGKALAFIRTNHDEAFSVMAKEFKLPVAEFTDIVGGIRWIDLPENERMFAGGASGSKLSQAVKTVVDVLKRNHPQTYDTDPASILEPSFVERQRLSRPAAQAAVRWVHP